jgi:gliding motility-associated-like protein
VDTVCNNQLPYQWNGNNYISAGSYSVTLTNAAGCDSVATLILTVTDTTTSTTVDTICNNQLPYQWNGNNYISAGTYSVTLTNAAGCDSVATLILTVTDTTTSTTVDTICNNQLPYQWNGNNYISAGSYSVTLTNAAGCDSVATLILTVTDTTTSTTVDTVCNNQLPYQWNGNNYISAGTYSVTLTNAAGCDSVATLILTIHDTTTSITRDTVCNNQLPYVWNGNSYNATGTYSVTLTNAAGCDSVATLILTIHDTTTSVTVDSICSNQAPYIWNGNNYTASGTYNVTLVNAAGCDSIATLILLVKPVPVLVINNPPPVCEPLTVDLTAPSITAGSDPGLTFTYWMDSLATIPLQNPSAVAVTGTYYIKALGANNCASTKPVAVTVIIYRLISGIRYTPITTQAFTPTQLSARNIGINYNWTPPVGLNSYNIKDPVFNYDAQTEYIIYITRDNGCITVDTVLVRITAQVPGALVRSDLFVPKAWTPNNDGHNDKLFPLTVNIRELKYFRIFNRWGQLVFETNMIGHGWDGRYNGKPMPMDVYTWTVEAIGVDGKYIKKAGNSVLIR